MLAPLVVEVARTEAERRRGLAGRLHLAEGTGMLFVGTEDSDVAFWNSGTLIPLTIAFLDAAGRILETQDMLTIHESLVPLVYRPSRPYRHAVEVPRGWFARMGLRVGDQLKLEP